MSAQKSCASLGHEIIPNEQFGNWCQGCGAPPATGMDVLDRPLKDSGERQAFSTGAQRDTQAGKGRYDLLPVLALRRLAVVLEKGAAKYDDRNWEKGIPLSRYVDSALRHLFKHLEGWTDEDHAAQALWNVACLIQTAEMVDRGLLPRELADLPSYVPDGAESV